MGAVVRVGVERALGLALGGLLDAWWGDPRRGHPVAALGRTAAGLEGLTWGDSRRRGAVHAVVGVGVPVVLASAAERMSLRCGGVRGRVGRVLLTAIGTWAVLGARSLASEGATMARLIEDEVRTGDLGPARSRLSHLAGRDPSGLDAAELSRATVESLAENTSDAVVAPLLWGAVAGLPGLVGYRAVNTLDAMVGHRSPRYERFGWAAARLDDVANLLPARATALLAALLAPVVAGSPAAALRTWRRDGGQHPSPNAGPVEASFAGALGIRLGGTNTYHGVPNARGVLGDGRPVAVQDVPRAVRLAAAVDVAALALALAVALGVGGRGDRGGRR